MGEILSFRLIMSKLNTESQESLKSLNFIGNLLFDIYQFFFNLPLLILALFLQREYKVMSPTPVLTLLLRGVNLFLWICVLPLELIDISVDFVIYIIKTAESSFAFYLINTTAVIAYLIIGRLDKVNEIRDVMAKSYLVESEVDHIAKLILEDVIEEVLDSKEPIQFDDVDESKHTCDRSKFSAKDESGYLTEFEVEE